MLFVQFLWYLLVPVRIKFFNVFKEMKDLQEERTLRSELWEANSEKETLRRELWGGNSEEGSWVGKVGNMGGFNGLQSGAKVLVLWFKWVWHWVDTCHAHQFWHNILSKCFTGFLKIWIIYYEKNLIYDNENEKKSHLKKNIGHSQFL